MVYQDVPDDRSLADPLPESPLPLFGRWLDEARGKEVQPRPDSMSVATVDADGRPSSRIVLCRGFDEEAGFIVFYTNRESRKGRDLAANPRAAATIHWDPLARQVRIEGPVTVSPDDESDAYWETRPRPSQIAAWASRQSDPIGSRAEFLARLAAIEARFADHEAVPRPPFWGGYRVWIESIELWVGAEGRAHDRALWSRELRRRDDGFEGGPWSVQRLQP